MSLKSLGHHFGMLLQAGASVAVVEPVHPELHVRLEFTSGSFKDKVDSFDNGSIDGLLACVQTVRNGSDGGMAAAHLSFRSRSSDVQAVHVASSHSLCI